MRSAVAVALLAAACGDERRAPAAPGGASPIGTAADRFDAAIPLADAGPDAAGRVRATVRVCRLDDVRAAPASAACRAVGAGEVTLDGERVGRLDEEGRAEISAPAAAVLSTVEVAPEGALPSRIVWRRDAPLDAILPVIAAPQRERIGLALGLAPTQLDATALLWTGGAGAVAALDVPALGPAYDVPAEPGLGWGTATGRAGVVAFFGAVAGAATVRVTLSGGAAQDVPIRFAAGSVAVGQAAGALDLP